MKKSALYASAVVVLSALFAISGRLHMAVDGLPPVGTMPDQLLYGGDSVGHQVGGVLPVAISDPNEYDVIPDGSGNSIVALLRDDAGTVKATLQKFAPDGSLLWNVSGVEVFTDHQITENQLVSDGAGGAFFVFIRDNIIRVQGVNSDGTVKYPSPVILATEAPCSSASTFWRGGFLQRKGVAMDGSGGIVIAWDAGGNACVQRMDADGNLLWGAGGKTFDALGGVWNIAGDDSGGIYIGISNNATNVLHLDANGDAIVGCPLDIAGPGWFPLASVVSDGVGGVLVFSMSNGADMYVNRMQSDCTLDPAWPVGGVEVATSVYDPMSVKVTATQFVIHMITQNTGSGSEARAALLNLADGSSAWGSVKTVAPTWSTGTNYGYLSSVFSSGSDFMFLSVKSNDNDFNNPSGGAIIMKLDGATGDPAPGFGAGLEIMPLPNIPLGVGSDGAGGINTVYREDTTGNLAFIARFDSDGASVLPDPMPLVIGMDHDISIAGSAWPAIQPDGTKAIVWTENIDYPGNPNLNQQTLKFRTFNPDGTPLSADITMDTAVGAGAFTETVSFVSSNNGNYVLIFRHYVGFVGYLSVQTMDAGGNVFHPDNGYHFADNVGAGDGAYPGRDAGGVYLSYVNGGPFFVNHIDGIDPPNWNGWTGVQVGAAGINGRPYLVQDSGWGLYAVWSGGGNRVHATHVTYEGTIVPGWEGENGVLVQSAHGAYPTGAVIDASGNLIISYFDAEDHAMYAQKINENGVLQWGDNGVLAAIGDYTSTLYPYSQHHMTVPDAMNGVIVSWIDMIGANPTIRAQRLDAAGARLWGENGITVDSTGDPIGIGYDITNDGAGGAIFAYYNQGATNDFRLTYVDDTGIVSYGGPVTVAGDTLVTGKAGIVRYGRKLFVTWMAQLGAAVTPSIYGEQYLLPYSTAGTVISDIIQSQKLAIAPSGIKAAVWSTKESYTNDRTPSQDVINLRLFGVNGNVVGPGDGIITVARDDCGDNWGTGWTDVIADATGFYVLFIKHDVCGDYGGFSVHFAVQKYDMAGTPLWGSDGVTVPGYYDDGFHEENRTYLALDGAGGVFVAYPNKTPSYEYLGFWAQRIDASGAKAWGPDGIRLSADRFEYTHTAIAGDGRGGVYIAWKQDAHYLSLTRLDASGAPLPGFDLDGIQISDDELHGVDRNIQALAVVPSSDGSAFFVYKEDEEIGPSALYVKKVAANGTLLWNGKSRVVATSVFWDYWDSQNLEAASDGAGGSDGMIIAYQFTMNSWTGVFLQRINANGDLLWGSGPSATLTVNRSIQRRTRSDVSVSSTADFPDERFVQLNGVGGTCHGLDQVTLSCYFFDDVTALAGASITQKPGTRINDEFADSTNWGYYYEWQMAPDKSGGAMVLHWSWTDTQRIFFDRIGQNGTILPGYPEQLASNVQLNTMGWDFSNVAVVADASGALLAWDEYDATLPNYHGQPNKLVNRFIPFGSSPAGGAPSAPPSLPPAGGPAPVTVTGTTATICFTNEGNAPAGYRVYQILPDGTRILLGETTDPAATCVTVTDLTPDTTYTGVVVVPVNDRGEGTSSPEYPPFTTPPAGEPHVVLTKEVDVFKASLQVPAVGEPASSFPTAGPYVKEGEQQTYTIPDSLKSISPNTALTYDLNRLQGTIDGLTVGLEIVDLTQDRAVLRYRVTARNDGQATAYNIDITDRIPDFMAYQPESTVIDNALNTDANDPDRVVYINETGTLKVKIPELKPGETKFFTFDTVLVTRPTDGIRNKATATYTDVKP